MLGCEGVVDSHDNSLLGLEYCLEEPFSQGIKMMEPIPATDGFTW